MLTPDEVRLLDNSKAILFVRGERPLLDDKCDLMRHPNIHYTEDGGAPPYRYAETGNGIDDLALDAARMADFELLDAEDFFRKTTQ